MQKKKGFLVNKQVASCIFAGGIAPVIVLEITGILPADGYFIPVLEEYVLFIVFINIMEVNNIIPCNFEKMGSGQLGLNCYHQLGAF